MSTLSADAKDPVTITADTVDSRYDKPFIAVDELREDPVPHRYIHGGFEGTDARFSFYFPPKEKYEGRFFHNTYPMATTSDIGPFPIQFDVAAGDLGFTIDSGAYYVQTNLGGTDRQTQSDPTIGAYRVNAVAAQYSRVVAAEIYGAHRPFGYLFGGSGGSVQVKGAAEGTSGIWDGFLPFVLGTSDLLPCMFTIRQHAMRILRQRNKFPEIMDAINPGGSGDPYAGLEEEEAGALREATLLGFPTRGWWNHDVMDSGYYFNVAWLGPTWDPTYCDDFWSKPGYLGTDPKSKIRDSLFTFETSIAHVREGSDVPYELAYRMVRLAEVPDRSIKDAHMVVLSGPSEGKSIPIARQTGKLIGFAIASRGELGDLQPGTKVRIDNRWTLAMESYHRHQMPRAEYYPWDQYRDADGQPIYPQRDVLVGQRMAVVNGGALPSGRITAKVLALETLMDVDALPWQVDFYRSQVKRNLGPAFEDNFALWLIDHAQHDNPQTVAAHANTVSFAGALQQGLRDLAAWVEKGIRPAETAYKVVDTQMIVPPTAAERGGVQPVVSLTANGGERAEVAVGEPVAFAAVIEVPQGAGKVIAAEWDFEGVGTYPDRADVTAPAARVTLSASHAFAAPGTYFPVLRVAAHREGDGQAAYGRIQNIGRVRVVVR